MTKLSRMMIDADICIKLGGSIKYHYLEEIVPMLASEVFMHKHAYNEVMIPGSAKDQLRNLITKNNIKIVDETMLLPHDRAVYDMTFIKLERVMIDPRNKNKNRGEVCSLSYAKAVGIPVFATDEMDLQTIIDAQLNNGIADIKCLRIIDIIKLAHDEEIPIKRKIAKALWVMSGKKKEHFDQDIWPQYNK